MNKVKTRFAPSPTGMMHIGNVRTALYAYLTAKHSDAEFILRIEDTDRERFVEGATEEIIEILKWLGLSWDEGPIYQSQRLEIYKKYADELIKKGLAYQKEGAIWFKIPEKGETSWIDLVGNKKITIENSTQKDFVMIKSDGYPTYNFAVVVDDHLMEISPIVRGVEFISSTPKHVMVYEAFGWEIPQFAHLPLFLGSDRSKLSKRHGAQAASEFKKDGFLPEAILNYLALLSWTPKSDKEILSLEEMIKEFSLDKVHLANAVFDIAKLEWMNGMYLRKMTDEELIKRLQEFLVDHPNRDKIGPVVPLIKERMTKLSDFVPLTDFIWEKPEYDDEVFKKIKIADQKIILEKILGVMESLPQPWMAEEFEKSFRALAEDDLPAGRQGKIKAGDLFQLIRVAVSGQPVTPPLFESIKIMGEAETINRVKWIVEHFGKFYE